MYGWEDLAKIASTGNLKEFVKLNFNLVSQLSNLQHLVDSISEVRSIILTIKITFIRLASQQPIFKAIHINETFISWIFEAFHDEAPCAPIQAALISLATIVVKIFPQQSTLLQPFSVILATGLSKSVEIATVEQTSRQVVCPSDLILHQIVDFLKVVLESESTWLQSIDALLVLAVELTKINSCSDSCQQSPQRIIDTLLLFCCLAELKSSNKITSTVIGSTVMLSNSDLKGISESLFMNMQYSETMHDYFLRAFQAFLTLLVAANRVVSIPLIEEHMRDECSGDITNDLGIDCVQLIVDVSLRIERTPLSSILELQRLEMFTSWLGSIFDCLKSVNDSDAKIGSSRSVLSLIPSTHISRAVKVISLLQDRLRRLYATSKAAAVGKKGIKKRQPTNSLLQSSVPTDPLLTAIPLRELRNFSADIRRASIDTMISIISVAPHWLLTHREEFWTLCLSTLATPLLFAPAYKSIKELLHAVAAPETGDAHECGPEVPHSTVWIVDKALPQLCTALRSISRYSASAAVDLLETVQSLIDSGCSELLIVRGAASRQSSDDPGDAAGTDPRRPAPGSTATTNIAQALLISYSLAPKGSVSDSQQGGEEEGGEYEGDDGIAAWKCRVAETLKSFLQFAAATASTATASAISDASTATASAISDASTVTASAISDASTATASATASAISDGSGDISSSTSTLEITTVGEDIQTATTTTTTTTATATATHSLVMGRDFSIRFLELFCGDLVCLYRGLGVSPGPLGLGAAGRSSAMRYKTDALRDAFGSANIDQLTNLQHILTTLIGDFLDGPYLEGVLATVEAGSSPPSSSLSSPSSPSSPSSSSSSSANPSLHSSPSSASESLRELLRFVQAAIMRDTRKGKGGGGGGGGQEGDQFDRPLIFEDQMVQFCAQVDLLVRAVISTHRCLVVMEGEAGDAGTDSPRTLAYRVSYSRTLLSVVKTLAEVAKQCLDAATWRPPAAEATADQILSVRGVSRPPVPLPLLAYTTVREALLQLGRLVGRSRVQVSTAMSTMALMPVVDLSLSSLPHAPKREAAVAIDAHLLRLLPTDPTREASTGRVPTTCNNTRGDDELLGQEGVDDNDAGSMHIDNVQAHIVSLFREACMGIQ